ncbi:MAG: GNAT family N-acetyltransferase [Sphingomonadaceae bacterium]|nr:GNAT family N-acetyltransferase [Sphingomonadaceae bacterium]
MTTNPQTRSPVIGEGSPAFPESGLACTPWRQMAFDKAAWDDLARSADEPNPFYESWFLLPSLEQLDPGGDISILSLTRHGKLVGLMPIVRRSQYGGWPLTHIGNWLHPNIFFGAPLVSSGAEDDFWHALLDWSDANAGLSLFLHLELIALTGPVHDSLVSVLAGDGRAWGVVERKERAILASDLDADAYLAASLSARTRKDLNRRFRRLSEQGEIEFSWEMGSDGIADWADEFLALEASGWKGEEGSALMCDPATGSLFRQSLTGAADRERLVRLSLRVDGKPIAMLSTFLAPPGAFGFKTAYDEEFSKFAPGLLLEREFLTALDRLDISWCDSCAASDHSVMNRIWRECRPVGRVSIAIGGPLRRAAFDRILRKEMANLNSGADA